MVSGGYKGASININDWLIVGLIGVAAYFLWKSIVKPTTAATSGIGEGIGTIGSETGQSFKAVSDFFQQGWGYLTSQIGAKAETANIKTANKSSHDNFKVSSNDYVTSVKQVGSNFGIPVISVKTSSGKGGTINAIPNTFNETYGIGFNAKGQGYSSYKKL